METYRTKADDLKREWHVIDATGKTLGKLASQVANLLMGKHKSIYSPHLDTGDYVVVVNAAKIKVTGKKMEQKIYYRHSGYPGGLKSPTLKEIFKIKPEYIFEHAVKGMLPNNNLGRAMFKKLRVYPGNEHRHQAQTTLAKEKGGPPLFGKGHEVIVNE